MAIPYAARDVKCPYYKGNDSYKVMCEGVVSDNSIYMVFKHQEDRRSYMVEVCNTILGCRDCPVYMMLEQMYGEGI